MAEVDWETIVILSELRSRYNLFDEKEVRYYDALSKAIKSLKGKKEKRSDEK